MKTIFLILILSTLIFAADGDTLITTFDLPAVTANNDSILQWFVDVLSSDSTDTTTRRLTYSVLLDLMKADTSFSEQSFTAAFNARLDSFLTLATTEIDTTNFVAARRTEWRGFFPHADSVFERTNWFGGATWGTEHRLHLDLGTAQFDSNVYIGHQDAGIFYNSPNTKLSVNDTVKQGSYLVTFGNGTSLTWSQNNLINLTQVLEAANNEAADASIVLLSGQATISAASQDTVGSVHGLSFNADNLNPYYTSSIGGISSTARSMGSAGTIKGLFQSTVNYDSLNQFMYGAELLSRTSPSSYYPTYNAYTPNNIGLRIKVENYGRNYGAGADARTDNMFGINMWLLNYTDGDSAVADSAVGYYVKAINNSAGAYMRSASGVLIDSPENTGGRMDNIWGLHILDQSTASPTAKNWAIYAEGPKSYIEDLRTDTLTVSDSISTAKLHITDIASYDSDRNITDLYHLTDKRYVDEAVTALGARYYMIDDASGEADYKSCSTTASTGGEQSVSGEDLANDDYVQGWIAPNTNEPDKLLLGVYNWRIYAEKTGGTKTLRLYWKLVERKNDDSEVVIATSVVSNEVISGKNSYIIPLNLASDYDIASDSYVVGKIYADVSGGGSAPDVTLYYEGSSHSHWQIPVNTEILDNLYVKKAGDTMTGTLRIGKTDPDSTLDVDGSGHFSTNLKVDGQLNMDGNVNLNGNYLSGDGDDEGVYVDSDGNVGIGTEPTKALEVNGETLLKTTATSGWASILEFGAPASGVSGTDFVMSNYYARKLRVRAYNKNSTGPLSGSAFFQEGGGSLLFITDTANPIYFATHNRWSAPDMTIGSAGNVGIGTTVTDSGRVTIALDSPWALVLGNKASTPWSAIKVGDASFTTSSDSTKKRNIKRKIARGDTTVLSRLLNMPEADWYWDGAKVKREKFNPERHYGGEWDSLNITKKDSIRSAWIARREARIAKLAERKRFGPMAQDVANALGPEAGDGESINWDRVNSEYRRAVQELIVIVRKQQEQIDNLTKRIEKLEKKKTAFEPRLNQEFTPYDYGDVIIVPYGDQESRLFMPYNPDTVTIPFLKNTLENLEPYIYQKTKPLPLGQD